MISSFQSTNSSIGLKIKLRLSSTCTLRCSVQIKKKNSGCLMDNVAKSSCLPKHLVVYDLPQIETTFCDQ